MTTLPAPRVVLASASPRRRDILPGLGISFTIGPSRESEPDRRSGEGARSYATRLARLKARSVARRRPSALVIGADTVVSVREHLLAKPAGTPDAARMLRLLSGRWHEVVT